MNSFLIRLVLLVPGMAALLISVYAYDRSTWGEWLADLLGGEILLFGLSALLAGPIVWATLRSQATFAGILAWLHLPGIASQSSLDWAQIVGWTPLLPQPLLSPWSTAILVLVTAVLFAVAWRIAREIAYNSFRVEDLGEVDRDEYMRKNMGVLLRVVGGASGATFITLAVAFALSSRPLLHGLEPLPVVIFGLVSVVIISLVVYYLRLAWATLATVDKPPAETGMDNRRASAVLQERLDRMKGESGDR